MNQEHIHLLIGEYSQRKSANQHYSERAFARAVGWDVAASVDFADSTHGKISIGRVTEPFVCSQVPY